MELIDRFGDVPWVNTVLNETSPEMYAERTPRAEVADSIIARLEYAAENLGDFNDGDNTITVDVIKAALSRFLLREGTWAKYHGLDEPYEEYLRKCLAVSQELMTKYPTLYYGGGTESEDAAGYGELWTTENLNNIPGVIFYKQYLDGLLMHRGNDLNILRHIVWMYHSILSICFDENGYPINNPNSGYKGGKVKICGILLKVEIQDCIRIFSLHTLSLLILQELQIMSLHSQHGSS